MLRYYHSILVCLVRPRTIEPHATYQLEVHIDIRKYAPTRGVHYYRATN